MPKTEPPPNELARQGSFDALRLAFVLAVIYTHSVRLLGGGRDDLMDIVFGKHENWRFGTGDLAVYGFFVLSGFLISMSWERSRDVGSFMANRMLRIYPGFVVATLISVLIVWPIAAPSIELWKSEFSPMSIFGHILRLKPPEGTAFVGTVHPELNTSMWSISHEFRCYLMVAAIGWALPRRYRPWVWAGLLAVCVAILGSGWVMPQFPLRDTLVGGDENEAYLIGSFAAGALYFHSMKWHHHLRKAFPAIAGALLVFQFFHSTLPVVIPLLMSVFLVQIGLSRHIGRWLPKPPVDISYGSYLYGWPIQKLLILWIPTIGLFQHVVASSILAMGFGWLSWTFVESRFMRLKVR